MKKLIVVIAIGIVSCEPAPSQRTLDIMKYNDSVSKADDLKYSDELDSLINVYNSK